MMDFLKIKELDSKNYLNMFNRQNVCFTHGEGNKLYDTNNKEYIDFFSGIAVNCLGYNYPPLVDAISNQAKKLMHISNIFYNEPQAILCDNLLEGTIFNKMALFNSGAEANEAAIKIVRKHFYKQNKNKTKIITALNSFHGRTLATATATGQEKYSKPFAPLPAGFVHVPYNDLDALKKELTDDVGAVMLECIQGESGVKPANFDYLINVYALCKAKDIFLIIDEVQTGMGRTGTMFCFEHYGIQPDIITLAKGLGAGFPIGAILTRGDASTAFVPGDHGSTFGGNALACAAANVVVDELKNKGLLDKVVSRGEYLSAKLAKFKKYKFVTDVRGLGLLQAIELSDKLLNAEIVGKMLAKGFVINGAGNNTLRLAPPYTITNEEIDSMCVALDSIFAQTNI